GVDVPQQDSLVSDFQHLVVTASLEKGDLVSRLPSILVAARTTSLGVGRSENLPELTVVRHHRAVVSPGIDDPACERATVELFPYPGHVIDLGRNGGRLERHPNLGRLSCLVNIDSPHVVDAVNDLRSSLLDRPLVIHGPVKELSYPLDLGGS